MSIGAAVFIAFLVLLAVKFFTKKKYKLPPGPSGIPLFGNVFQLDESAPHVTITKWSDTFGNVFRMKTLGRNTVVLSDFDSIYDAMVTNSNTFAGRPDSFRLRVLVDFSNDITFTTFSPKWVFIKKTAMQALKMYGDTLENLEVISLQCIDEMVHELNQKSEGGPLDDIYPVIHRCVTAIMASLLFAHKLDDFKIESLLKSIEVSGAAAAPSGPAVLLDLMPWLRFLPNKTYSALVHATDVNRHWFKEEISERRKCHEPGNRECVIDALFDDQATKQNQAQCLSDSDIYGIMSSLIFAGTITTSITTHAFLAVLINKPEIQNKMVNNIHEKIGNRSPCLSDRKRLPYIDAALFEIFRYSSIVPIGLPHSVMEDTQIAGYDIPKGTEILFNLWKLHHNPDYWDEPWEFKPERFLDEGGNLVPADHINRKRLLAFGAGRRVCVGETLAKNRLFLLVTSLLQHFEFLPVGPDQCPKHDPREYRQTFGIQPYPYKVKVVKRHSE